MDPFPGFTGGFPVPFNKGRNIVYVMVGAFGVSPVEESASPVEKGTASVITQKIISARRIGLFFKRGLAFVVLIHPELCQSKPIYLLNPIKMVVKW